MCPCASSVCSEMSWWLLPQGRIQGGNEGDASPPPIIFNNALDKYKFFIFLNFFITICLSRLKQAYSKLWKQNGLYLVKHSELKAKNKNKVCQKIVQKAPNWPLQSANFQNYSGGACPRTPLELCLLLKLLRINFGGKTYARKSDKI